MDNFKSLETEQLIEMRTNLIDMLVHYASDMVKSRNWKEISDISKALAYDVQCIKDIDSELSIRGIQ